MQHILFIPEREPTTEQFNSATKLQFIETMGFIGFTNRSMGERLLIGEGTTEINLISEKLTLTAQLVTYGRCIP